MAPNYHAIAQTLQAVVALHATSLVDLNLLGCSIITGANLQTLMCSCPSLRSLVALGETMDHPPPVQWKAQEIRNEPCLDACAVEFANSWVCLGLERLRFQIRSGDMTTGEDQSYRAGIPRAICGLIKKLKQLRDLRLCLVKPTWEDSGLEQHSRDLPEWVSAVKVCGAKNINDALQVFGGLKELETLELRSLKGYIDVDSMNNAKKTWGKLKWVYYD